jgi:hypothetical protein
VEFAHTVPATRVKPIAFCRLLANTWHAVERRLAYKSKKLLKTYFSEKFANAVMFVLSNSAILSASAYSFAFDLEAAATFK